MKLGSIAFLLTTLVLAAGPALAQRQTPGGGPKEGPGKGGGWRGPGDTVPTGAGPTRPGGGVRPGGQPGPRTNEPAPPIGLFPTLPTRPHPLLSDPTAPEPVETPANRPETDDESSWELWWHYNRWSHLDVAGRLGAALTGSSSFFLGRGQSLEDRQPLEVTRTDLVGIVLPALSRAVAVDSTNEYRIHALHALAKVRGLPPEAEPEDFADVVHRSLVSDNQDVAEKAVLALGIRGEPRFYAWLDTVLNEREGVEEILGRTSAGFSVRVFAAYALGLLGERAESMPELRYAIHASLSEALHRDSRPELQSACLLAIGLNPLPADPEAAGVRSLEDLPTTACGNLEDEVLEVLAFFEDRGQNFLSRSQAPNALARLLTGAPDSLRSRVVLSLAGALGPHTREPREVQNGAVLALASLVTSGSSPLDETLRDLLADVAYHSSADRLTRYLAMVALGEASARPGPGSDPYAGLDETRKILLRQLALGRGQELAWTALALGLLEEHAADRGQVPSADVGRALRSALETNRSAQTAGALAIALGLLRDPEANQLLLERLDDTGETHVRGYVALALGMAGAASARARLGRALEETVGEPFAVQQVALALALLGATDTAARVTELFKEAANPESRASLASALGWIGDPRPLKSLTEVIDDEHAGTHAKAWAAVAIGRIVDGDRWPWVGRLSVGVNYEVDLPELIEPVFQSGLLDLP